MRFSALLARLVHYECFSLILIDVDVAHLRVAGFQSVLQTLPILGAEFTEIFVGESGGFVRDGWQMLGVNCRLFSDQWGPSCFQCRWNPSDVFSL